MSSPCFAKSDGNKTARSTLQGNQRMKMKSSERGLAPRHTGDGQTSMSSSDHHSTQNKFRKRSQCARQRCIFLKTKIANVNADLPPQVREEQRETHCWGTETQPHSPIAGADLEED